MKENITYFQKFVKSYLRIVGRHPRYLQTSSGCKEFNSKKNVKHFHVFNAFLHPKRPNPKIPKNRKKCIFLKKSIFPKWLADHHKWSKMVPNNPPECSKHISSQYLAFIPIQPILDNFFKNRKKSIFEIFFRIMHQQNRQNYIFPAENRPNIIGDRKNILMPLSENFIPHSYGVFRFLPEKIFTSTNLAKIQFLTLRSFWLQKSIKNVKIFIFSESSKSQLSVNIHIHGYIFNR